MADFAHSAFAQARREAKAVALETACALRGLTAAQVAAFTDADRRWFEKVAGVRPSSVETWARVEQLLRDAEQSPARTVRS